MLIYSLYYTEIPESDISKRDVINEEIPFDQGFMTAGSCDFHLNNVDRSKYDNRIAGTLFYGVAWYNQPATIYDTDLGDYIYKGRIKNIRLSEGGKTIIVETANYVRDLAEIDCEYSASNIAPIEAARQIMQDSDMAAIPDVNMFLGSFSLAKAYNENNDCTVDIDFAKEDNKKCLGVIAELCRIGHCAIYPTNNRFKAWYYQAWSGNLGIPVRDVDCLVGTYEHWFEPGRVYNDAIVKYDNAGAVGEYTADSSSSINTYGRKTWSIPDENVGDTVADYHIIIDNYDGAKWVADTALTRFVNSPEVFTLTLKEHMLYAKPGEQIDLDFDVFHREPARIVKKEYNPDTREYQIHAEYLNLPVQVYDRDLTPPNAVFIQSVIPLGDNKLAMLFTASTEDDHLGYYLYFATSRGSWRSAICSEGQSYLEVLNPSSTPDGLVFRTLQPLENLHRYYFKIESTDTSYNRSDESNIGTMFAVSSSPNLYRLTGNIIGGLTLDITNAESGTVPADFTTYADLDDPGPYDAITAVYVSPILDSDRGFTYLQYVGIGDAGDIKIQYRTGADGTTWTAWSEKQDAVGLGSIDAAGSKYLQYRAVFYSPSYSDTDKFYVKSLEEAA